MAKPRSEAQWNALGTRQRTRYTRYFGSEQAAHSHYVSGGSLTGARGKHSNRSDLVSQVRQLKNNFYGARPGFHQKRSDETADKNPATGAKWTIKQLTEMKETLTSFIAGSEPDDYDAYWDEDHGDYAEGLYYH